MTLNKTNAKSPVSNCERIIGKNIPKKFDKECNSTAKFILPVFTVTYPQIQPDIKVENTIGIPSEKK